MTDVIPIARPTASLRVAFLDDHQAMRQSLHALLSAQPGLRIVGAWQDPEEMLVGLRSDPPDVVLMDLQLGGVLDGIAATAMVRATCPETQVLVLTLFDDKELVFRALKAGAMGYVLKRARPDEIVAAIEEVAAGGAPMTGSVARSVIEHFRAGAAGDPGAPRGPSAGPVLSEREFEILRLLGTGSRYKEVAAALGISHDTVRSHVRRIYRKLHVNGLVAALNRVRELGFHITPADPGDLPHGPG